MGAHFFGKEKITAPCPSIIIPSIPDEAFKKVKFIMNLPIYYLMKSKIKQVWDFFWNSDSPWSWLVNIVVAFVMIKFVIYPLLGLIMGTGFPIVAVVSESMEHGLHNNVLCGKQLVNYKDSYDNYWKICGGWYEEKGISKNQFKKFPFNKGFYKGDIIIVWGTKPKNLQMGDVLIFQGHKPQPLIHRIIKTESENGKYYFYTKGDHNSDILPNNIESKIPEEKLLGRGIIRIPYLGWVKIIFVEAVKPLGINIVS